MTHVKYNLASNSWDQEEEAAIARVLVSGRLTMGPEVKEFEEQLATFHRVKHAVMVNSGSSANLIALAALTYVRERSLSFSTHRGTVIAPAVSWSTTYFPFSQLGYKLLLIDVDDSFNLDLSEVRRRLTADCVGLISVNLLGVSAQNDELLRFCNQNDLFLFEDNCESFGATLNGQYCGTFGAVGTLSFFFSHHLQTMEGGALLTNDSELANCARSLRAHGWTRDGDYRDLLRNFIVDDFDSLFKFVLPGYCVRPLEMSGAIGKAQLKKWDRQLAQRRDNAALFSTLAATRPYVKCQREIGVASWFGFGCIFPINRDRRLELWRYLLSNGIESRPIVAGNFARQPVSRFLDMAFGGPLTNADAINDSGMFFGNDGIDLSIQITYLFEHLDRFFSQVTFSPTPKAGA